MKVQEPLSIETTRQVGPAPIAEWSRVLQLTVLHVFLAVSKVTKSYITNYCEVYILKTEMKKDLIENTR